MIHRIQLLPGQTLRAVEVGRALVVAFDPADRRDFPAGVVARELSLLLM
jgi:hypothetical protein